MMDSEVGRLWRELHVKKPADIRGELYFETMTTLIRKLVGERKKVIRCQNDDCFEDHTVEALRDFDIPLNTYEKEKVEKENK